MRDNRDTLEKLRATIADMEYMEVPGEWLVPVEEAKAEITRLRADNERLRAALELFACDCLESELCKFPHACRNYIARAVRDGQPAPGKEEA